MYTQDLNSHRDVMYTEDEKCRHPAPFTWFAQSWREGRLPPFSILGDSAVAEDFTDNSFYMLSITLEGITSSG